MILQALVRYYQRLLEKRSAHPSSGGIAPYGYSPEKISYEIVLGPDGAVRAVNDIRDTTGKKPQPRMLDVPQPEKRTVGINSNFLWDKTSYVLGVSATSKRADKEHEAFKALHESALAGEYDEGLKALLAFLQRWTPDQFQAPHFSDEMQDANFVFRLGDEYRHLHEREAARALRARLLGGEAEGAGAAAVAQAVCLVNGVSAPIARLHPAIKGVIGAQSSGASLVSFNLDAFTSYGKSRGDNAPVSEHAAFAYTSVLNYLLRGGGDNRQRLRVGDTTVLFWAEAAGNETDAQAAENFLASLFFPPDDDSEADRLRGVLDGLGKGRPLAELDPGLEAGTRMYVLGLAPNASRLSVRYWQVDTLEVFAKRLALHAQDLRIEPLPWRVEPTVYRLLLATVPNREGAKPRTDDAFDNLVGETMRAILSGGLYPRSLLGSTVMRIRSDGNLSGMRAAICKGVLARERRLGIRTSDEEIPVSLNKQSTQPGYLLGRLFAVLEYVQRSALGGQVNATIRDRYYGAASATPAAIFPVLLRNTQNHLGKLRKERPGQAVTLEKEIREIVENLPDRFPRSLKIEDQGRFAIGYYHQSHSHFTKRDAAGDAAEHTETETEGAL
ncbi:MAG: type I-C CRISPR-associated protein Cas8c/Csd1 [Aromatoleum sp.]|jgi:CRISPR-associated protein Csd1|uniref:type I-C CRISPR-associated protein Cas8c/Csd1 n=1 Tax=Aromatoleum sp. TaxID=2307007 RepID=UPI0028938B98|nr:type I-C CRISPR-associated protein Cas8c/Csd1 [Aromatoleum sp.]MDT3672034.1 type I-C CRISPR-associated protein Cas8c/Csd1 [Aromatoleum sp.]